MKFRDESAIRAHYFAAHVTGKADHPDARHPWDVCDRKFVDKRSVKRHLAKAHGIGDLDRFQCDICARVFNQKCHLNVHYKKIHG